MKNIEISKILQLAKTSKYESAVAAFDLVDHIFKVEVPRNLYGRKHAVQAMSLLADEEIHYGYTKEQSVKNDSSSSEEE